ncbi:MAG: NAD(P)-dependent oxidoreductase [Lachnospiraceae bacterium]|nr:NAD(P)-dependent oxidoreductase [Lachnospiraceae bacterium]
MKRAIVTGANGFVGSALCRELTGQGIAVTAVVREHANIDSVKDLDNISIIECDLSDFKNLAGYIGEPGADVFYHLAWIGSAGDKRGNSDIQINNIKYTCDTVKACAELQCKRYVFASSIMEYEIAALMNTENVPEINTLYSSAKIAADYMARTIAGDLKVDYIRAVISNIYGPGESSPRLVNTSIRKLLAGEHCSFSEGRQMYDFIYITDAAKAFVKLGEMGISNRTYYIGSTEPKQLREFLMEIRDVVSPQADIGLGEIPFLGVSLDYGEFDVHSVQKDTGFTPEVAFKDGVRMTAEWIRGNGNG